jgi:hypothetical protein
LYNTSFNYCRICQENYQDFLNALRDIQGSSFKKYVHDNILSKINSKELLIDQIHRQRERFEKEELEESERLKTLKKLREPDDPLPTDIDPLGKLKSIKSKPSKQTITISNKQFDNFLFTNHFEIAGKNEIERLNSKII